MNSIDDADVPEILKQAFKDNEAAIRKDEREKILGVIETELGDWLNREPDVGERCILGSLFTLVNSLRQQEQSK